LIVTLDKDFGELAVLHAAEHRGIVRLVSIAARSQGPVCLEILTRYAGELASYPIITVEPGRVRIRSGATDTAE
jgi:predicted nuclease of predicted toxin-antitoxin system